MEASARQPISFKGLYATALGSWLVLTLAAFALLLARAQEAVDADFHQHAETTIAALRDKLRANDAVLSGFASFLAALEASDRESAREYAGLMLDAYPHIHRLEVVRKVEAAMRERFELRQQAILSPQFRIRRADALPDADKAAYYPLVFAWPERPETVLGLDLDTVPPLKPALMAAEGSGRPAASAPFRLADGELAYALFRAAPTRSARRASSGEHSFAGALQAGLIIKASALYPAEPGSITAYRLEMLGDEAPATRSLFAIPAAAEASTFERRLLPEMKIEARELSNSQPLQLTLERQMRFSDLSGDGLKLITLLSLLSFSLLSAYLRKHYQELERAQELEARAAYLALHDPLTGLPNRNLLADRVHQSLATWRRHGIGFALLFLDLDRFKEINDQFGHDAGDRLLGAIARRIEAAVRESDTVARYGGDEFVVLISESASRQDVVAASLKILEAVAQPIDVGRTTLCITTSVGMSVCPDDGDSFEALLSSADTAMYRVKTSGRNGLAGHDGAQSPPAGASAQTGADGNQRAASPRARLIT